MGSTLVGFTFMGTKMGFGTVVKLFHLHLETVRPHRLTFSICVSYLGISLGSRLPHSWQHRLTV